MATHQVANNIVAMSKTIKTVSAPDQLSKEWDYLADSFYMKKAFLYHLQNYNYCFQLYYELYENDKLVCGTIVYTLNVNILTFSKLNCVLKMRVIGIPVSIATPPLVGDEKYANYLLDHILQTEKGIILGINFIADYCVNKVSNMRTLPTIVMKNNFSSFDAYIKAIRSPYRRRLHKHELNFKYIESIESSCQEFTETHYSLYLEIMKRTKTKLEILSFDLFKNLPANFMLTSHYINEKLVVWQICTKDKDKLYFLFGGMDYTYRDRYSSYYNNLLSILRYAIDNNFTTIDFGQTAELAKLRLGGELSERRMFIFHRNAIVNSLLKLAKPLITNFGDCEYPQVFKQKNAQA